MKKRILSTLLAVVMLTTTMMAGVVTAQAAPAPDDATEKYVTLDGEWNFKLYRTYSNMFQYIPYAAYGYFKTTWEDNTLAAYPADSAWKSWDTVQIPTDNPETGGLLDNETFPSWAEAWIVREFDLPADFTEDETVTLLMGIIDDNDVVYINGTPVASSGFVDGTGAAILDVPATGGFVFDNSVAAENQVKWSKSYWEIQREYTIPTEVLNLGGTNEMAIRVYNNNGFGGFYLGHNYAICGNDLAVRNLKGLPTTVAESPEVEKTVAAQIAALTAGDVDAYAATITDDYHNNAEVKADKVAAAEAMGAASVTDAKAAIYLDDQGYYWYSAQRTINGTTTPVELCYEVVDGVAYERGNWSRCYPTSYSSELFGKDLTYSVYLPPSYYENEDIQYPTVWLLHGRASSSTSYRNVDHIGEFMDEQIAQGNIAEMVLIMPDSGKYAFYRDSQLKPSDADNTGPWRTQLVKELRGVAEDNYRLIPDAKFRGLSGNSMGGFGAMAVGTSYPDVYSSIGVHMPYLPEEAMNNLKSLSMEQLAEYDFYLDAGLQDATVGYSGTVAIHDYLVSVGKEHGYALRDGGHNSAFYMAGMVHSMKMHSDHFLGNDLYVSSLPSSTEKFNWGNPADVTFTFQLNGNIIDSVDLPDGTYTVDGNTVTVSYRYLVGMPVGTVPFTVTLKNGQVFEAAVEVFYNEPDPNDTSAIPTKPAEFPFTDVSKSDWFYKAVKYAHTNEIMAGVSDSAFDPESALTRAMVAQVLYNWDEDSYSGAPAVFTDVPAGQWYTNAVNWAAAEDIVSGYGNGLFGTLDNVTREQLAMILYNYAVSKDYTVSGKADLDSYKDADEVSSWAVKAVEWAVANDILRTENSMLAATENATRAEVAFAMMNFCEKVAK